MRSRFAIVLVFAAVLAALVAPASPALAQAKEEADMDEGGETIQDTDEGGGVIGEGEEAPRQEERDAEGEGQSDADAETGAGEGEQQEGAVETGPPWTYQMAWISLVLLLLMGAGIGLSYYRLIVLRQRGRA